MPYEVRKSGDEWCVYKADSDKKMGCHPSKAEADAQIAAIYANEKKEADASEKAVERPSQAEAKYTPLSSISDKACANCRWFSMIGEYGPTCHLIDNYPQDISPTGYCDRHELAPTPEPLDMPMMSYSSAEIESTPEIAPMTDAKPTHESVVETIKRMVNSLKGRNSSGMGFKIVGNHWFITWSNNFEDRDAEIFTVKAIDHYVARVDMGIVPPPEVWVWHTDAKTRIGQAEWVARHGHFLIAVGTFDADEKAQRAKAYYTKHAAKTAVSHGFTYPVSQFDGKHYHEFNTFELSLLPRGVEANRYTSLEKVKAMSITDVKRQYLTEVFGEEQAKQILDDLDARGKALEAIGVEFKDFVHEGEDTDASTSASKQAVESVETDLKAFVADIISDSAAVAGLATDMAKALKSYKADTDKRLTAQDGVIAALKAQLDDRPRSASRALETVIEADGLEEKMKDQFRKTDPFTGLPIEEIG